MTNRDKLRAAIEAIDDEEILADLAERIEMWDPDQHEDGATYDIVDAFIELDEYAERFYGLYDRCQRIFIDAGYYRVVTDAELASTPVSERGLKYDMTLDRIKYRCAGPIVAWLDGEAA